MPLVSTRVVVCSTVVVGKDGRRRSNFYPARSSSFSLEHSRLRPAWYIIYILWSRFGYGTGFQKRRIFISVCVANGVDTQEEKKTKTKTAKALFFGLFVSRFPR